ncbi:MAG: primosomal protein N', partial [Maribacter sp.]|nr:primosomal protein N' [Maribacter sp.]
MQHFINVILPIPLEKLFTYRISKTEFEYLEIGMRVAVPFGKSKIYTVLVYEIHSTPPELYEAKEIHKILDEHPIVNKLQLQHWRWIADYYMCTVGEVFRSALPSAFLLESETLILRNERGTVVEEDLKDDEFLVFEALQHQSTLKVHEVSAIVDKKNVLPILNRLLAKNVILLKDEIYEQYKPKLVRYVKLGASYQTEDKLEELLDSLKRAPKQSQVVLTLFQLQATDKKPIKVKDLESSSGTSKAVIKALISKGILEEFHIKTDRVNYEGASEYFDLKKL